MYGRKRVYGGRARSKSAPSKKAKTTAVTIQRPRFRTLKNPYARSLSNTMRMKMIYFENFTINPGAGLTGVYQFSANGIYDPNVTGVGHQPVGFDQLMAIWSEYTVLGSTIKVYASNEIATEGALFGVFVSRNTTTSTDFREYVENGDGVYRTLDGVGTGQGMQMLQYQVDMNKQIDHSVLEDEGVSGNVAANPSEQRFYHIVIQPFNFATDFPSINFCVEITYDVLFRDRVKTAVS